MKRTTRLKPRSKKMAKFYKEVRVPYVKEIVGDGTRPCPVRSPVCSGYIQGVHEKLTRARAGGIVIAHNRIDNLISCWHYCKTYISEHKEWSESRGLLLKGDSNEGEPNTP